MLVSIAIARVDTPHNFFFFKSVTWWIFLLVDICLFNTSVRMCLVLTRGYSSHSFLCRAHDFFFQEACFITLCLIFQSDGLNSNKPLCKTTWVQFHIITTIITHYINVPRRCAPQGQSVPRKKAAGRLWDPGGAGQFEIKWCLSFIY